MTTIEESVEKKQGENYPLNEKREENMKEIFQQCDTNNDGKICIRELDSFIRTNGAVRKSIPKHIIFKINQIADKDGDEQLSYEEFVHLITHKKFQDFMNEYVSFLVPVQKPQSQEERGEVFQLSVGLDSAEPEDEFFNYYTCVPPPLFIICITVFEIAYFLLDQSNGEDLMYDPRKRDQYWRLMTYALVHVGTHHLIVNMLVQVVLGIPLEMVHKWWRVMIIYITGGIGGSMLHSISDRNSRLAGASGSVYAIMTAHVANVIMNWGQMKFPYIQLICFGFLAFYDLGYSIYDHYILNIPTNVGILAHVGGALSGMLVGIYTLRNISKTSFEMYIWWIALTLYILFIGSVLLINIFVL